MQNGIYWLASYPKSGNTWMRIVLTNYILDGDEPADINNLETDSIASNREMYDEILNISSSDLTEEEIRVYQPDVFREIAKQAKKDLFIKVHDAYTLNFEGKRLFPADVTKGVLYIVRNPLDVAVSYSHHSVSDIDKTINKLNDFKFTIARSKKKLASQLPQKLLNWSGHVTSWRESGLPFHLIRYEDMLEKPSETFFEALTFLGFEVDEKRLEKAIRFSSFQELQKQESSKSFKEKPLKAKSFFRSGQANTYNKVLSEDQVNEIISKNQTTMKSLGYIV